MGKYRGVPAHEKYAEGPRPLCECHAETMRWHMESRGPVGGYWRCADKIREYDATFYAKPEKRRQRRASANRWEYTPSGMRSRARTQLRQALAAREAIRP